MRWCFDFVVDGLVVIVCSVSFICRLVSLFRPRGQLGDQACSSNSTLPATDDQLAFGGRWGGAFGRPTHPRKRQERRSQLLVEANTEPEAALGTLLTPPSSRATEAVAERELSDRHDLAVGSPSGASGLWAHPIRRRVRSVSE
jgi:hypothetical protein